MSIIAFIAAWAAQVAGWLGISVEEALNEAGPSSERQDEQGRRAPG